jgi:hypothetical protein
MIGGGFAVAAAAPLIAAFVSASPGLPTHLAACQVGEDSDLYTGACVPYLVPNTPGTAANNACPAGVSGAECTGVSGSQASPPGPPPPSPELQELEDVATPGY